MLDLNVVFICVVSVVMFICVDVLILRIVFSVIGWLYFVSSVGGSVWSGWVVCMFVVVWVVKCCVVFVVL